MDYWSALWFWPIERADLLPDREEWLADLAMLLESGVLPALAGGADQRELFAPTMAADTARTLVSDVGFADVEKIIERSERLKLADLLAERYRFLHWDLEYADVFTARGGFDLVLGNPPWVRVEWRESAILGDGDPSFVLGKLSARETADRRSDALAMPSMCRSYAAAHEEAAGLQAFLSARQLYAELVGVKVNLYKAFLKRAWMLSSWDGVVGLLHPDSIYDDPKGRVVRREAYARLRRHYQFTNEKHLFPEVHNQTQYALNVYGPARSQPRFLTIANLLLPATVDECHTHDGSGDEPGIKDEAGDWETRGHIGRIVQVSEDELAVFARLYDEPGTPPSEARLPALHSGRMLQVLRALQAAPLRLGDVPADRFIGTFHFNETYAHQEGTIRRGVQFPASLDAWVVSGPHFFVGNPLYKCPRREVKSNKSYDVVDLNEVPENYRPRTIYVPNVAPAAYRSKAPVVPWCTGKSVVTSDCPRVIVSKRIGPSGERTLQAAILPAGPAHVGSVYSYAFQDVNDTVAAAATWSAVPLDFFLKTTGSADLTPNIAALLPIAHELRSLLSVRILALCCLTRDFGELWRSMFHSDWNRDGWALEESRLRGTFFTELTPRWSRSMALRTDFERRAGLVELDVLVSRVLGLTLAQLRAVYRVQFPIMRMYEVDTWYDRVGRIVFTPSRGLTGVGLPRSRSAAFPDGPYWQDVEHLSEEAGYSGSETVTQVVMDDTLPGGPREKTIVYHAPWVRCDRERDYEVVWKHFEERFGKVKSL